MNCYSWHKREKNSISIYIRFTDITVTLFPIFCSISLLVGFYCLIQYLFILLFLNGLEVFTQRNVHGSSHRPGYEYDLKNGWLYIVAEATYAVFIEDSGLDNHT